MAQLITSQSLMLTRCAAKVFSCAVTICCHQQLTSTQLRIQQVSPAACARHVSTTSCRRDERFEPPYLHDKTPKADTYPLINIQMKGYDFPVLQGYQSWVHKALENMGINVSDSWATPCQTMSITRMQKEKKDAVEDTIQLKTYERTVQVSELPCTAVPVMLEALQAALPQGVDLYIDHHSKEVEDIRYVPNRELKELRQQIYDIQYPTTKKQQWKKK